MAMLYPDPARLSGSLTMQCFKVAFLAVILLPLRLLLSCMGES